jgi:hypothetical protein
VLLTVFNGEDFGEHQLAMMRIFDEQFSKNRIFYELFFDEQDFL